MNYFDDLVFDTAMQQILSYGSTTFVPESFSLELISCGSVILERDGRRSLLSAPVLFWMDLEHRYRFITNEQTSTPYEHLYCNYHGSRAERITETLNGLSPQGILIFRDGETVTELFREMIQYYRLDKDFYHAEMVLCVEKILTAIAASLRPVTHSGSDPYRIRRTAAEIRKNPFRAFDFAGLAADAGITVSHFRRLFRAAEGMPPHEFLRRQQLRGAAAMLQKTDMRIKEIVDSCHFSSLIDFSRAFKKFSGYSPREYRIHQRKE